MRGASLVNCPRCGTEADGVIEVTTFGDPVPQYLVTSCQTAKCGQICRTCRRDIGDVHGPHCWEHMVNKVERPHIVDRSDCQ